MDVYEGHNSPSTPPKNHVDEVDYDLEQPSWSLERLKEAALEQRVLRPRSLAWAILLQAVPPPNGDTVASVKFHRNFYDDLRDKLCMDPRRAIGDDPLSQNDESVWRQHFCDNELKNLILQDVVRTFPDELYFREKDVQDLMVRVLFYWARSHSYVGYRQGMHEILAPLLFELYLDRKFAPNDISSPCTDRNHFFLAPGVLTAGGTNRACVSRFYPDGPARMLLSLATEDKQTTTASRELPPGDGGCLDISVPLLPNTKADLIINVWYPEVKCTWERRMTVRVASGRVVVVHTERARYRPGETLRARVFALKADLTPAPGNVEEIWVEGPPGAWEGTRVAQWTKVRSKLGLAQVQHNIDELAPPGRWTVRARLGDGSQGSSVFWVGNYELPPFQLTVRHAPRVLRTSERLVWTVCVRYPWTEAVEGMLVIRLRGAGGDSGGVRTAVRLRAPRACHRHAAAARRVGLGGDHPPDVVVADFSFQEEGTRVWQNTTVVSQVVDKPITLEFVTRHRTVISPGLPYKLKVKATRWDDKPALNERIRVCRSASRGDRATETNSSTCISGDTDSGGVARVMFAAEDDGSAFYQFEASLANDSSIATGPLTLATRRSATQAALGPLRADSRGSRTFVPLYLSLQNVTTPVTVHFVVITRGGIIYRWGATTQCPIASSAIHVQTASRNGKCDDALPQYEDDSTKTNNRKLFEDQISQYDKNQNQYDRNQNQYDRQNNRNGFDYHKSRSYDVNSNQYIDHINDKTTGYIIRNMNQNDKNNYLHKTNEPSDRNHTVYDRFSTVYVNPNVNDKVDNVNSVLDEANASDALLDRHLLRVMLPIKVTQQMCPDSHLIAYFYYNGEFVSASKHFEMDDCFVNKVEATFLSRQALPGSQATLQVSTPGPAICALTALDSAAKFSPNNAVKEVLMRGLRRMIDGHRNLTEYDAAGECFLSADIPQVPTNSLELTATWLAAAGVRAFTDVVKRSACEAPAALIDEGTMPRSDFSEAWLWRLVTVGSNGSALTAAKAPDSITRYEASAVCLSKTGVAVSPPAVLQVFREFFIHADGPKRLRRGDSTIIRYRLFNYLYEPLSIQIQVLTDPLLLAPPEPVQSVCVPPRASAARRVPLRAAAAGAARVVLRGKAVSDGACRNSSNRRGVSDEVVMTINIDPEGVPVQEHKSIMLCAKDGDNSTKSAVEWSWPPASIVPGSESLTVWVAGDLVGPLLADADALVALPRGCGEQNMARLAANLLALEQLEPSCSAALAAREHVARGFTRQLQYVHPSGGFSAFGASDSTSSTWLTAFCVRYLRTAHQLLWPNQPIPPAIEQAERWLLDQQMENGCFRNEGQVFHRELRGGLNEEGEIASVALTAYVITSLVRTPALPARALRSSLACLRALPPHSTPARVYAHSLLAYAFMRLGEYEEEVKRTNEARYEDLRRSSESKYENLRSSEEASWPPKEGLKDNEGLLQLMELLKMARREGEYLWWETGSLSTSVEATSYALLALRTAPPGLRALGAGAVRWLGAHRGPTGGFVSTQDTLVALEALSAWSSLQPAAPDLTVRVATPTTATRTLHLLPTAHVPELLKMEPGDQLNVEVEGSGCALVQATRAYNTAAAGAGPARRLAAQLAVRSDGPFDCDGTGSSCYCAAVIEACAVWSGSFPEMALMEVSLPGGYGADASKLYSQLNQPNSLLRRIELTPTSSRATLYLAPRDGATTGPRRGHACFNVHAVGARGKTKPGYVRLMDYYSPSVNDTQTYTIPEDCPPRVSHEASHDLTDNLYNKARSVSDGEILITQEFTFEDIPEGIPLEDPLYDNLTRRDKVKDDLRKFKDNNTNTNEPNNLKDSNKAASKTVVYPNRANKNREVIKSETQKDKIVIDDKLDLNNRNNNNVLNKSVKTNETTTLLNIVDNKLLIRNNEDHKENGFTDTPNYIANNPNTYSEKQRSIPVTTIKNETKNIPKDKVSIDNEINKETTKPNHRIEIREEHESDLKVDNPKLTDFHIIDSEKDLEVPSGLEGPVPVIVLPPLNFVPPYLPASENFVTQNVNNNFRSQSFGLQSFAPQNFRPALYEQKSSENYYTTQNDRMLNYYRRWGGQ